MGLVVAFVPTFLLTQKYNKDNTTTVAPTAAASARGEGGQPNQQGMMGQIAATLEAAKNNPKDFNAQIRAAEAYYQIQQFKETVVYLDRAYQASPAEFDKQGLGAYELSIQQNLSEKNYAQADTWFGRALKANPQNADLLVSFGESYVKREPPQPDRAIENIRQALQIDPKNAHAMEHLVEAYALKKDMRSAEDALNKLKESNPGNERIAKLTTMLADVKAGKPLVIPKE
jgi:tetratricopeptide (TPR) repeat protein